MGTVLVAAIVAAVAAWRHEAFIKIRKPAKAVMEIAEIAEAAIKKNIDLSDLEGQGD